MPLDIVTTTVVENGMGIINGVKGIGLATDTALEVPVMISGGILIGGGIVLIGVPVALLGVGYISKKLNKNKTGKNNKSVFSPNTNMLMSLAVASTLCVSVGTAMLSRTETVMIIHVIAGYTCLVLSIIHVYQYRKVLKAQAKKFWQFLSKPKAKPATAKAAVSDY